jgi:hypothetical protein
MVLDRGSGLVGEFALRQAKTSSRSVIAETRSPAGEPAKRWRRSDDTSASVATRRRRWRRETSRADERATVTGSNAIPGGGKAEEGSDIGHGQPPGPIERIASWSKASKSRRAGVAAGQPVSARTAKGQEAVAVDETEMLRSGRSP